MLTGKKAFSGETVSDTLAAILTKEPDWSALRAPDSSKVGELLRRCLQRDAKQRLRDIGDARILLEEELAAKASLASVAGAAATGSLPFEEKQAAPSPTVARSAPPSRERGGRKSLYLAWAVAAAFAAWAAVLALRARTPGSRAPGRPLVRFRIAPPSGGSFNGMIALSPDGSRLAAVVTGADGLDRIFLRPLDAVEMHAVPGTDGAAYPFFSPDGRSIGYFASETLRTVDLEKESVRTLCRARNPRGGTWGPDGTILFAANIGGEIDRVPAAGGESSRILAVSADVASLRWPCFLPDGRRFLAFSWNANGKSGLVAGALDSSATVPVMPTDSGAVFASGFLYFLREGKLVRAPFDVAQLKVTGSAEPLGEDVFWDLYSSGYAGFAVSQAGVVAWHAGGLSLGRFVWYDRSGKLLGAIGPPGPHFEPDLSPDGKTVAFSRTDPDTSVPGTWLLDLLRGSLARLSLQPQAVTPLWRPDGKSVAYSTFPAGTVFERDAGASSSAVKLFENGTFCILEDWAPDGRIFFTSVEDMATFRTSIRVRPTGGGAPQTVLSGPFSVQAARLSPDGHWLAYVSDESGIDQVLVRSYPEGNERFTISAGGGTQPRWRGDGKELFYVTPDAKIMSVPISTRPRFEPGRPVMLFQSKILPLVEARNHYVVTRDGQRFLVNSRREEAASFPIVVLLGGGAEPRP
jgi:Tol biopolymer transport system component